jgi:uncharacterized delta-60 repeat protein
MKAFTDDVIRWSFAQIFLAKRKRRIGLNGCVLFFVIMLALSAALQTVRAANGDLDATFGNGGKILTDFSAANDNGRAVVVQPDGKIIVAGQSGTYPLFHSALARYNADGSLDQSFGVGGRVVAPLDSGGDSLTAVVLQPDGKIVAAGTLIHNNAAVGCLAARFNSDGSLDQTFGNGGSVIFDFGDVGAEANAVVLQPDGKIIVVGTSGASYGELTDFALARFNSNGSFDQNYGSSGMLKTHFTGEFNTGTKAFSAVLQPDGKLVVAGAYKNEAVAREFALARYNTDGNLDATFGSGGKVTTVLGSADAFAFAVKIQPDGKIVLAGYFLAGHRNHDFAVARYNSDGSLDTTFGSGGYVINDLFGTTDDIAYSLAIQTDGKLIVGGRTGQYPNFKFGLARYNPNGSFDQTFGSAGKVNTAFSTVSSQSYGIALQTDGKIIIAGYAITGSSGADFNNDFALARYTAARYTPFDFDGDSRADISIYRGGVWYLNRSTAGFLGFRFGLGTDKIVPADYDGDGKTDLAVYRPSEGNWYWLNSGSGTYSVTHFGESDDIPAVADYDGDGRADYAVFRNGFWYIQRSTAGSLITQLGQAGDKPVTADYDGDGKADLAIYRQSVGEWWILRSSNNSVIAFQFGNISDMTVQADFTGDGKTDIAIWRPSTGEWFVLRSENYSYYAAPFGTNGDIPVVGDYDGDAKADMAIYRGSGEWWIWRSRTNNYSVQSFGNTGDKPVPAAYAW